MINLVLSAPSSVCVSFKAALCSFGEETQTLYNINEVIIQTQIFNFS